MWQEFWKAALGRVAVMLIVAYAVGRVLAYVVMQNMKVEW